jgi:hypothetical protein
MYKVSLSTGSTLLVVPVNPYIIRNHVFIEWNGLIVEICIKYSVEGEKYPTEICNLNLVTTPVFMENFWS